MELIWLELCLMLEKFQYIRCELKILQQYEKYEAEMIELRKEFISQIVKCKL